MRVKSLAVVEHLNVVSDILAGFFSGFVFGEKDPFRFQAAKKLSATALSQQFHLRLILLAI
jgi:hypothetical protein